MKYCTKFELAIFMFSLLLSHVFCDIPVHCVKSQIAGTWLIKATKPLLRKDIYKFSCGHSIPSKESNAYLLKPNDLYRYSNKIELKESDEAIMNFGKIKKVLLSLIRKGDGRWFIMKDLTLI